MKTKHIIFTLAFILFGFSSNAQKDGLPVIGAQVFLEPGQTNEEVENWFKILHDQEMTVCRVFMIETHMHKPDGTWDFERYDFAFKMALQNPIYWLQANREAFQVKQSVFSLKRRW